MSDCTCGCKLVTLADGRQYCAETLARFRLIHGYDYAPKRA